MVGYRFANSKIIMKQISPIIIVVSLAIGLAPYTPPHIVGKIQWILGGGVGIQIMDLFDLLMHVAALFFAVFSIIMILIGKWQLAK